MRYLLKLARSALESELNHKKIVFSDEIKKKYGEKKASFVTLTINNELRGCIGSLQAHQELYKDVIDNSINAGFNDPRFPEIDKEELKKIKIEISILTIPEKLGVGLNVFNKIDNKMGIILKKGFSSSTFLPQVWQDLPDKIDFLEHLSRKAGLSKDDWKDAEISFYRVESIEED